MFGMIKKAKFLLPLAALSVALLSYDGATAEAYPGSGQSRWSEETINLVEPTNESTTILTGRGALVNPLGDIEAYLGKNATFGSSCLSCHGGEGGAQSPEQPYHNEITYEVIRTKDGANMVQPDGSIVIEVHPDGSITNYKLIVGLSKDAYDGGYQDARALAGWHFSMPEGIRMDLPYCMHILGPGLSKIYEEDSNKVFSDIKVSADSNFQEGMGILQLLAGTQNADPMKSKVYGTVVVHYKYSDDVPVDLPMASYNGPESGALQLANTAGTSGGAGITGSIASANSTDSGSGPVAFYLLIAAAAAGALVFFGISRKPKQEDESKTQGA
ncbi:hypothetical protein F9B85_05615 [Heliorestis acidaminivorans]|uniref:Cytochrome c domain-containing protein n=1 Tax=Heliorestis acidaminivorans TaxID=553427 RepID=A0A6I0F3T4_9FIRM|nr:hypothetical protein [Heliorestis acidaminivorans]KAB2953387.1 hypothetical protein F9B85_05615 [Heliorestis acidaminivorans]